MTTTTQDRITAFALTKTYGEGDTAVHAVHDLQLSVAAGEVVLLMGPSGSGKTTLLTMLGGLLRPTSGEVIVDGTDIAQLPERRLQHLRATTFGFVFQDFNLLRSLTAAQNVQVALDVAGTAGTEAHARVHTLFDRLGLAHRTHFDVDELSGGEKQRVAIARALANEPAVVLADEPTANLDSANGAEIMRMLADLAREQGSAVIVASHDERIREIADRVLWLEDGAFRQLADLARDPACGMLLDPGEAPAHATIGGATHHFCSEGCQQQYLTEHRVEATS